MKFFICATRVVLSERKCLYATFSPENTHANVILATCELLLEYSTSTDLLAVLELWLGWSAGDPRCYGNAAPVYEATVGFGLSV